jgi:hypothetical protein
MGGDFDELERTAVVDDGHPCTAAVGNKRVLARKKEPEEGDGSRPQLLEHVPEEDALAVVNPAQPLLDEGDDGVVAPVGE